MKSLVILAFVLSIGAQLALGADTAPSPGAVPAPATKDAAWLERARAAYPLTTCVVSGEGLGDMSDAKDYIHQQEGKPDRLVRFCCAKCLSKFEKDPARYLRLIDEASAGAAKR